MGAGVSGLAAAVSLAQNGIRSIVFDQKPGPGGRATSFRDAVTGKLLDNGQHVLIAGYRHTMEFLDTIGTRGLLSVQASPSLILHHPERGICQFNLPKLISPIHLLGAVTTNLLNMTDRLCLVRAGIALRGSVQTDHLTIREWLGRLGQSDESRKSFWNPLAVSIMNEMPERAAAGPFLRSLQEAFMGHWRNGCIAIPRVDLVSLYAEPACRFLQNHGSEVRLNADVKEIRANEHGATGLRLRDGTEFHGSAVILSVPPHRLPGLLPGGSGVDLAAIEQFSYVPIVSTHLWFPDNFFPFDFFGLVGRRTQWIFNRSRIEGSKERDIHLSTVISAAHQEVGLTNEEIIALSLDDLRSTFGARVGNPTHSVVVREKRATFSLTPEAEKNRPTQKTAIPNLFLAGDWTNTGFPATIESAVISGNRCAELIRGASAH